MHAERSTLSRATQAYCDSKLLSLASTDAGAVREGNERTACTASEFFQKFCRSQNFDDLGFLNTPPVDSERIIVCFAMEVAEGKFSASGKKVGIKTVKNYVREAAQFAINISKKDPRYRYDEYGNKLGGENDYIPGLK